MLNVTELIGFGAGGMGSTLWRLVMDGYPNTYEYYTIPECEMRASRGGVDQCVGGTPTANSTWSATYPVTQAFDDIVAVGYWSSAYLGVIPNPIYVQYEFPAPVTVGQVALFTGTDPSYRGILDIGPAIHLEYYDTDLSVWTRVGSWTGQPYDTDLLLNVT